MVDALKRARWRGLQIHELLHAIRNDTMERRVREGECGDHVQLPFELDLVPNAEDGVEAIGEDSVYDDYEEF